MTNKDRGYKPPGGILAARPGVVRCLGPGREHLFHSPDVARVRVCDRCRRKFLHAAPVLMYPMPLPD